MILIVIDDGDISAYKVIDWLIYFKIDFQIITQKSDIQLINITINNDITDFEIIVDKRNIFYSEIVAYWWNRGEISDKNLNIEHIIKEIKIHTILKHLSEHLIDEKRELFNFLYVLLEKKPNLGSILKNNINKMNVLINAKEVGLTIPYTFIVTQKKDAINFIKKEKIIVTKSISRIASFYYKKKHFLHLTESIKAEDLNNYDNIFFPSLLQKEIDKLFEIRTFYLKGKFFSMAIFSQSNEQTKVDFRNYDYIKPNRIALFNLPEPIQKKLIKLMNLLSLETGSIDLIYSKNNEYVFLEVNPVGIIDMVSIPCNYYLEKIIAEHLIKISKNERNILIK